jgi:hypothetical protein
LTNADRQAIRAHKPELLAYLHAERTEAEYDRQAMHSIITVCEAYGVALRIDPGTSDLVVGSAGAKADEPSRPWPSLLRAIEAHPEDVARLVEAGWSLTACFPKQTAA